MKKIALISNSFISLYNFRYELIHELLKEYDVTLVCPMSEKDYTQFDEYRKKGCHVRETELKRRGKNPFADMLLFRQYVRILGEIRPDLVITYTIKPNIYAGRAAHKLGIPYFINVTGIGVAFEKEGILKAITTGLYRKPYKDARKVFFQNNSNKEIFHAAGLVNANEHIVPGSGINLNKFALCDYTGECADTFIYIARLQRAKGTGEFLNAACRIRKERPESKFIILGQMEEPFEDEVNRLTAMGGANYYGWQDTPIEYIRRAGCMVNPSYHEGMSNVCLEASAMGRVVIASNIPGCREIVEDNVTGFLVEPQDEESLYREMIHFLDMDIDSKRRMGMAGRAKIEAEFDRNKVIEIYKSCISDVIG